MTTDAQIGVVDQTAAGSANTKAIDTVQLFNGAGTTVAYRQTMAIGDPSVILAMAPVDQLRGLTINFLDQPQILELLGDIKTELQNLARLFGGQPVTGT